MFKYAVMPLSSTELTFYIPYGDVVCDHWTCYACRTSAYSRQARVLVCVIYHTVVYGHAIYLGTFINCFLQ